METHQELVETHQELVDTTSLNENSASQQASHSASVQYSCALPGPRDYSNQWNLDAVDAASHRCISHNAVCLALQWLYSAALQTVPI